MREIKFRGQAEFTKEFVFGSLIQGDFLGRFACEIHGNKGWWKINPETVGQFTGLLDKNGKEIYEGDILRVRGLLEFGVTEMDVDENCVVRYGAPSFYCECLRKRTVSVPVDFPATYEYSDFQLGESSDEWFDFEVIGTIHENPELLRG